MRQHRFFQRLQGQWREVGQCCAYCNYATQRVWSLKRHYNNCDAMKRIKKEIINEQELNPNQRFVTSSPSGELCHLLFIARGACQHTG